MLSSRATGAPIWIAGVLALCVSCALPAGSRNDRREQPRVARETATLPDGTPLEGSVVEQGAAHAPDLRAQIPWPNVASLWGWGALRIWGRPRDDEMHVHAIVDAPARARRWGAMCDVRMEIDGERVALRASYIGRPLTRGVYDAVRLDLSIETLRAIARADRVEGEVCGDRFEIGAEQRATVARFVERFDDLAVPSEPLRGAPPSSGPDLFLPGWDDEIWPTPA
ncbi:hypothetical protein [Sandaracinus amylolyticus]|uniref:hypothetical protein n=1 Tax=Sandaracinus amylolyticus TaxID=927083 RepID=UPI0012EEBF03|nr:hypothetical protein [Sandaracinus amylolyticus]